MLHKIIGIVIILVTLLCYGIVIALQADTLISPWIPLTLAAAAGAASSDLSWQWWSRISGIANRWICSACHLTVITGILAAAFYSSNYFLADKHCSQQLPAVVESRYTETHYHTRRIGRNRYVQGEPYKVHYARVRFDDGHTKAVLLPLKKYKSTRIGDTITYKLQRGLFGIPVLKR